MLKKPNNLIFNDEEENNLSKGQLVTMCSINNIACYLEKTLWLDRNRIYETAVKIYGIDQQHMLLDSILAQLEELVGIAEDLQDKS